MALTRAQLLSGNSIQGVVLPGQVQGVSQGAGISIATNGQISVDAATTTGLVKTNNASAYNAYIWPTLGVAPGATAILQTSGSNTLLWTTNYVQTTGSTGEAILPAGTTGDRTPPQSGYFRYNTEIGKLEFYGPSAWETILSSVSDSYVVQTTPITGTASAVLPTGGTADRQTDPAPQPGYVRFNSDTGQIEVFDGASWNVSSTVTSVTAGYGLTGGGAAGDITLAVDIAQTVTIQDGQTITGGKTFEADIIVTDNADGQVLLGTAGGVEISRPDGAFIDFKRFIAQDFDARIDNIVSGSITITNGSGNGGLRVEGDITAFVSDMRLKTNIEIIDSALDKVNSLRGFTYTMNETGQRLGYDAETRFPGVSAQEVQAVLPEAVKTAPASKALGEDYLTVQYDKLVPLLIEAIKELSNELNALKEKL